MITEVRTAGPGRPRTSTPLQALQRDAERIPQADRWAHLHPGRSCSSLAAAWRDQVPLHIRSMRVLRLCPLPVAQAPLSAHLAGPAGTLLSLQPLRPAGGGSCMASLWAWHPTR